MMQDTAAHAYDLSKDLTGRTRHELIIVEVCFFMQFIKGFVEISLVCQSVNLFLICVFHPLSQVGKK